MRQRVAEIGRGRHTTKEPSGPATAATPSPASTARSTKSSMMISATFPNSSIDVHGTPISPGFPSDSTGLDPGAIAELQGGAAVPLPPTVPPTGKAEIARDHRKPNRGRHQRVTAGEKPRIDLKDDGERGVGRLALIVRRSYSQSHNSTRRRLGPHKRPRSCQRRKLSATTQRSHGFSLSLPSLKPRPRERFARGRPLTGGAYLDPAAMTGYLRA